MEEKPDPLRRILYHTCKNIPSQVVCILMIGLQCSLLDYHLFLSHGSDPVWLSWIAADLAVIIVVIVGFRLREWRLDVLAKKHQDPTNFKKGLPLTAGAWILYGIILAVKLSIIFKKDLQNDLPIGQVEMVICITAIVCVFFTASHHHAHENKERRKNIVGMIKTFAIDLLDIIDLLKVLYDGSNDDKEAVTDTLEDVVLAIMAVNLIRPAINITGLFLAHYGSQKNVAYAGLATTFAELFLVNFPLLAVRLYMNTRFDDFISVFLIKNAIGIMFGLLEIYDSTYDIIQMRRKGRGDDNPVKLSTPQSNKPEMHVTKHEEQELQGYSNMATV